MTDGSTKTESMKLGEKEIARLWRRYRFERENVTLRNAIIEHFLYLSHLAALKFCKGKPVEFEEMYSAACEGLLQAVDGFDIERGLKFPTFAAKRIRGAMFDYLRKADYVPRLERQRQAEYHRIVDLLTQRLGRSPTAQEIEDEMPANAVCGPVTGLFSIEEKLEFDRAGVSDNKQPTTADLLAAKPENLNGRDFSFLAGYLGEDDRTILYLYFFKDVTMHAIGALFGQSESRISQRVSALLKRLSRMKREEFFYKTSRAVKNYRPDKIEEGPRDTKIPPAKNKKTINRRQAKLFASYFAD